MRIFFRVLAASAYLSIGLAGQVRALTAEDPKSANAFVDAVGVDSHFNYRNTPYVLLWPKIRNELIASGIRHIRDGGDPSDVDYVSRLAYLGDHGIKHSEGFDVNVTPEKIKRALKLFGDDTDFVEPSNEYDGARMSDPDWIKHLTAEQRVIYATIHSDSDLSKITVLGPALARQQLYQDIGSLDAYEDAGNLHNTTCNANPGYTGRGGIEAMTALVRTSTQIKPIWTTETGYNDDPSRACSIPDDIIAKYDARTVAERFNAGEPRIYFYQLANMPNDVVFGGMGLLDADGNPKPQFTAIKQLLLMLSDPGPTFGLKPLPIDIEAGVSDVHHTLLEKRDGTYYLLLWRELPSWKSILPTNIGGVRVAVDPVTVEITTPTKRPRSVYRYDSQWILVGRPASGEKASSVSLQVTDAICVLELR